MDLIIETKTGKIKGHEQDGIKMFKGIPYAEPPIGELRLSYPEPKTPWNGVLDASEYGPIAPQPLPILEQLFPLPPQSEEECLNLNIWTPECDDSKRPVMFWIHGGSHITGSGRLLNGRNISHKGNIVLVTINYRLGPLGYLYIPGAPANIGELDKITALKWVKENIESFGGDPDNITIFGESAGATSVCALMAMPKAKGLFNRAISQSGGLFPGLEVSERKTTYEMILNELELGNGDIDEFRRLPVDKIINGLINTQIKAPLQMVDLRPYIDDETLPQHPIKAIKEGFAKDIELIVGTNLEEWRLWRAFEPNFEKININAMKTRIKMIMSLSGDEEIDVEDLINVYTKSREEINMSMNIHDIYDAFMTDAIMRIPSIKFAEAQSEHQKNTYMYMFNWKNPFEGGRYGAMHGFEIAFVFGYFWEDFFWFFPKKTPETESLSDKMMKAWVSFAKSGVPNHENIPEWPPYNIENRSTIIFDDITEIWDDPLKKEREMWFNTNTWSQF